MHTFWHLVIYALETGPICKATLERKKNFQIFSVMNQESMASFRVLNCGYFGPKSKVIGQVEEELRKKIKMDRWHFFF